MAQFDRYTRVGFTQSSDFLASDPSGSGAVSKVKGKGIIDAAIEEIKKRGDVVQASDTIAEAVATDYNSGTYIVIGSELALFDGGGAIYRVSDAGSSPDSIPMDNGLELVLIFDNASNLVASIDSIADLSGLTVVSGQQISVTGYHPSTTVGGGSFVGSTGVHNGGTFIDPNRTFPTPAEWAAGSSDPAVIAWFDTSGGTVDGWERVGVEYVTDGMAGGDAVAAEAIATANGVAYFSTYGNATG